MVDAQVLYMGRWVSREHFKAFVYSGEGAKLAKSYQEFSNLVSSGAWSAEPLAQATEESNVVEIETKRGKKCRSQRKA